MSDSTQTVSTPAVISSTDGANLALGAPVKTSSARGVTSEVQQGEDNVDLKKGEFLSVIDNALQRFSDCRAGINYDVCCSYMRKLVLGAESTTGHPQAQDNLNYRYIPFPHIFLCLTGSSFGSSSNALFLAMDANFKLKPKNEPVQRRPAVDARYLNDEEYEDMPELLAVSASSDEEWDVGLTL